jgi:cardiolipin synthase A/B
MGGRTSLASDNSRDQGRGRQIHFSRNSKPKGRPTLWTLLRRAIWAWQVWGMGAVIAEGLEHRSAALGLLIAALVVHWAAPTEKAPVYGLEHQFPLDSDDFLQTLKGLTGTKFVGGNQLTILNNGDQFYPEMIDAIERAKSTINIEAYIYWAGHVGGLFANALAQKARAGVDVKILLDAVGSARVGDEILDTLKSAGCRVEWYRPVLWNTFRGANHRTHRKSLVIDGRLGFTGGAGIADHWMGQAENEHHWRDIQVKLEGPALIPLQTGFARNWLETTNELISGPAYFPVVAEAGDLPIQTILSSPETGASEVRTMYYLSIVCARKSIRIANPYFIPDGAAIDILVDARKRGVDVKIMVMGKYFDNVVARYNSRRLYRRLLEAGIEMYEYNRTFLHHKYMVCDGIWSTVGTTNFDNRSFSLNEENSVCVYDRAVASDFEDIFLQDLANCTNVRLEDWRRRSLTTKGLELLVAVLQDQA